MAGTEIIPTQSDGGLSVSIQRTTPVGGTATTVYTYSGPVAAIRIKEAALLAGSAALSGLANVDVLEGENGRGSLVARYERKGSSTTIPGLEESIQELNPIEITRDIFAHPSFADLTNDELLTVRNLFEQKMSTNGAYTDAEAVLDTWTGTNATAMKQLYGHLTHGQEAYIDIGWELRQSWKTTSATGIRKSCSDINRVVKTLPPLNSTIRKLVSNLPDLEWLKKPTQLTYLGKGYWNLQETYIGLPEWSIIYGGSFTGLDT